MRKRNNIGGGEEGLVLKGKMSQAEKGENSKIENRAQKKRP